VSENLDPILRPGLYEAGYNVRLSYKPALLYSFAVPYNQREGMGPREYQNMPSLRDEAHDGWLSIVTTVNNNSWKFHQDAAGQLLSGQPVLYGKVREYGTSITHKSHQPGHSPPASQAGSRVGPAI
jgi:hypothetical protein